MLVQLGGQEEADRAQLDQVWSGQALGSQLGKVSVSDTCSLVESLFTVLLYTVQFLDQADHAFTVGWLNFEVLANFREVVADRFLFLQHVKVATLSVLRCSLASLVLRDCELLVGILYVEGWNLRFNLSQPTTSHVFADAHIRVACFAHGALLARHRGKEPTEIFVLRLVTTILGASACLGAVLGGLSH